MSEKEEKWNECNFVGLIKKKNINSSSDVKKAVELIDDYDERMKGESQWKEERW